MTELWRPNQYAPLGMRPAAGKSPQYHMEHKPRERLFLSSLSKGIFLFCVVFCSSLDQVLNSVDLAKTVVVVFNLCLYVWPSLFWFFRSKQTVKFKTPNLANLQQVIFLVDHGKVFFFPVFLFCLFNIHVKTTCWHGNSILTAVRFQSYLSSHPPPCQNGTFF